MTMLNIKRQPKILIAVCLTLIMTSFVFLRDTATVNRIVESDLLNDAPDYFINEVYIMTFNKDGVLSETLKAEQTRHYRTQSKTLLVQPAVERFTATGNWAAEANTGIIEEGSKDILLIGEARATKWLRKSNKIELLSDSVHYLEQDMSLTSLGNPTLLSPQGQTTATKIVTYIDSEKVFMTNSVRGIYETAN